MKNYYKILGVSERATEKDIHAAYRTLAKKYHPDLKKGSDESFKKLVEAYEVLKDRKKKELYDSQLAVRGFSERKTMIEGIFSGYLMSISAGVLFLYSAIILFVGIIIFEGSFLAISLAFFLLFAGLYLKYRSFTQ